ncbi:MAG: hypothetical protein ACI9NY_001899, partial [Kiritimatiellia bacterium]
MFTKIIYHSHFYGNYLFTKFFHFPKYFEFFPHNEGQLHIPSFATL